MFKKKESTSPEEKLLKIIEEPRGKQKRLGPALSKQKKFSKIYLKAGLKKINFLDLINRLLLGAGVVASVFFILTIFKPTQKSSLAVIPPEDITLLESETELDSYVEKILERNIFALVEVEEGSPVSAKEKLNLKLVGIISLGNNQFQAIIEDKNARTYLVNEGDTILETVMVEKIESDKAILKKEEEVIELK